MASGKKTGGKDFEPGQSGNPSGRPRLPEDIKRAKSLTKIEFDRVVNQVLFMRADELEEFMNDPNRTAIEALVASIVNEAVSNGDHLRTNFILDRVIGKVAEKIEARHIYQDYVQGLDESEFISQAKAAIEFLERKKAEPK